MSARSNVLVTGAAGYVGSKLVAALAATPREIGRIIATDVREPPVAHPETRASDEPDALKSRVTYTRLDVRDAGAVLHAVRTHSADIVVHLASIVTPGAGSTPALEYAVDVQGTRNVLDACLAGGVGKLIVTSSGAAYGYHADSPRELVESDALRGNEAIPYARHKRLIEEMLSRAREEHPHLEQLVFRPGTILGRGVHNPITNLFDKAFVVGVSGSASPFVIIWDEDVVACLERGVHEPVTGVFNLAGDGVITLREMAKGVGKPFVPLPAGGLTAVLRVFAALGLTRYRAEQVDFLRYRPVLSNRKLKEEFAYTPAKSTREAFEYWRSHR